GDVALMATIALLFMDPPHESATATTVLRIVDAAIRKGHNVKVMAYPGVVATSSAVVALREAAVARSVELEWMRCAAFEGARGLAETEVADTRPGSPADFYKEQVAAADNVLVIPERGS